MVGKMVRLYHVYNQKVWVRSRSTFITLQPVQRRFMLRNFTTA